MWGCGALDGSRNKQKKLKRNRLRIFIWKDPRCNVQGCTCGLFHFVDKEHSTTLNFVLMCLHCREDSLGAKFHKNIGYCFYVCGRYHTLVLVILWKYSNILDFMDSKCFFVSKLSWAHVAKKTLLKFEILGLIVLILATVEVDIKVQLFTSLWRLVAV